MWKQITEEQFYVLGELGIVCFYWPKSVKVNTDWFDRNKPFFNFDMEKRVRSVVGAGGCTYWTEVESSDNCDEVLPDV